MGITSMTDQIGAQHPFPDVCAHPECEKTPIVGVNKRFVCEDHMKWVLKPIRDVIKLVTENFND